MKSKELSEQRHAIANEMGKLVTAAKLDNARPLNGEEQEIYDRLDAEQAKLQVEAEGYLRIENFERSQLESSQSKKHAPDVKTSTSLQELKTTDHNKGVRGWLCNYFKSDPDVQKIAHEYRQSAERVGIDYNDNHISLKFVDQSAKTVGLGVEFVIPTLAKYIHAESEYMSNILQIANVMYTPTGEPFVIPISLDTFEAVPIAENALDTVQKIDTGKATISAKCYTSRMVNIPVEWVRSSSFPVEQFVGRILGQRIDRGISRAFAVGLGNADQPQGYANATQGATVAVAGAVDTADLTALIYSIPLAARESKSFAIRVSESAMGTLRAETAVDGRPLWQPSLIAGQPDTFDGRRIYVDPYLHTSATAGNVVAVAGDWSQFLIRAVDSYEFWDQRNIATRNFTHVCFTFVDSLLLSTTALKSLRVAA